MTAFDVDDLADRVAERVAERLGAQPDERPPLTVKAAAARLSVDERTVRDMIARSVLASFKVQGRRVIDAAEIDRYLAEQRAQA